MELVERRALVHRRRAIRAKPPEGSELWPVRPKFDFAKGGRFCLLAAKAKHAARPARPLTVVFTTFEESDDIDASENGRIDANDGFEAVLVPVAHRSGRRAGRLGGFANVVAAQPLDVARAMTAIGHRLAPEPFDKGANIFDAPGGRPRSDLDRLGITPVAHALPPSGFADRNNGRDWRLLVRIADDLGKAQVADFGQFVHVGSLRSKLR